MIPRIIFTVALLVIILVYVQIRLRHGSRDNERLKTNFLDAEREANSARRRDIDPALFYTPDLSVLPLPGDGSKAEEKVQKCAAQKMIRFPRRMTNIELKMAYGPSQLDLIAQYEEDFYRYQLALIELAETDIKNGKTADALRILEHTIALDSEYRKSYLLAADLYAETRDATKLSALLTTVEGRSFTDENIKRSIVKHIMDRRADADL